METVAIEKSWLVKSTKHGGNVFLNADDYHVLNMQAQTNEKVITFAAHNLNSDYLASEIEFTFDGRLTLKVEHQDQKTTLETQFFGAQYWLSIVSAFAVASELNIPKSTLVKQIASFRPLLERGGVINLPNGSRFLLDTNKAPFHSLYLALSMVKTFSATRKRILLGHISDSTKSNNKTYQTAYEMAKEFANEIIFVGDHIHRPKVSKGDIAKLTLFSSPLEAFNYLNATLIDHELIMIKGCSDLHLERIALAHIKKFDCWETKCGKKYSCLDCGIFYGNHNNLISNLSNRPKIDC